ncbi:ethanolamine kinase [Caenorhabditis elegans]|uniref:ethanolamine kinase n=1 Tax=Caenorhabditis elegans TaxID=6239 RepID=Q86MJ6_CAEEL|nr:Choline/ethanolamine kinase [Caenorhabditis elegans]CCD65080.1 Choline/ethanolamine kinase [Caenorhabditis elegans]|eukprot:NP_001024930.1 Choline Kinase C [Caenorhabditis elegans]
MSSAQFQTFDADLSLTSQTDCENSAREILTKLRPEWKSPEITFEYFSVGITNKIFSAGFGTEHVIFRVFGHNTNKVIDRENEVIAWKQLAEYGFAAPLYGKFNNGLICGFLEGKSLAIEQMRDSKFNMNIAKRIAQLHSSVPTNGKTPVFEKMRTFLQQLNPSFEKESQQNFFHENFPTDLGAEISKIEKMIVMLKEPIVFCHNDLLVHNIVYDSEKKSIEFIDYEYAFPNYALYDIANHFCEYAGVEGSPDYSKCLTKDEKWAFINDYLRFSNGKEHSDTRIATMFKNLLLFEAAAHLFWAVWALVQAQNSTIDFDYLTLGFANI